MLSKKTVQVVGLMYSKYSMLKNISEKKLKFTLGIVGDGDVKIKFDLGAGTKL